MLNQLIFLNTQKIYNFNEGEREVVKRLKESSSSPIIIAVFGVPDSGKTYLINFIGEHFESLGFKTRQRDNPEKINRYESWAEYDYLSSTERIVKELSSYDIIIYHCPWDNRAKPWEHKIDPEESVRRAIGRGLDLSIGIFNPKRNSPPIGNFDLVISNPSSWEKPWYPDD